MILLDTNVVSESIKPVADACVIAWLEGRTIETLFLSAMTLGELRYGVDWLLPGAKARGLEASIETIESKTFAGRILPFGANEARAFGRVKSQRDRLGRPIDDADAAIAATALTHGFTLATRNTKDFEGLGLKLVDPFRP